MVRKLFATIILSTVTMLLVAACSQHDGSCCGDCGGKSSSKSDPSRPSSAVEAVYVCPMHPEVKQASPGKCPKCGMELERQQ